MASVTSVSASPTTVTTGGGTSIISPVIANTDKTATITITVDGSTGEIPITLHEQMTYSVSAADQGKQGFVVATVDQGGTLAVGQNGTFVFTAS